MPATARRSPQAPDWKQLLVALGLAVAGIGCVERARIGTEPETENTGPDASIDFPDAPEVTVPAGPQFNVAGRVVDRDGVDTVYFELFGVPDQFQPHVPTEFDDTVRFSVPISTANRSGVAVTVLVFGTDREGLRGDTASRRIVIE